MYSYEERVKAVELYIQYDFSFASVNHEIGYPNNPQTLKKWFLEFRNNGSLRKDRTFQNEWQATIISCEIKIIGLPLSTFCDRIYE